MKVTTQEGLSALKDLYGRLLYPEHPRIFVGMATCGMACGSGEVFDALDEAVKSTVGGAITVEKTGCVGFCQREPLVDVWQPGKPRLLYGDMNTKRARELVDSILAGKLYKDNLICKIRSEHLILEDTDFPYEISSNGLEDVPDFTDFHFFKKQVRIVMRNCGFINPEDIRHYIARGGYQALYRVLSTMTPEEVIACIKASGIRGRGGAGFPTGQKWEACRATQREPRYIVCNADEGDPGAYMDRSVLEGDPHTMLEGMIIGAYAIGSHEGYVYVRNEYPQAIHKIQEAIEAAKEYGFLGKDIMGRGFDFDLTINRGGGAFVCGEETALLRSIEGKTGEPRQRPPFPAEQGIRGMPTIINNVETWSNVPVIMMRGPAWFSRIGTEHSKGTKVFSVVGKVANTGPIEVPMGITLREILYDICGGVAGNKRFKAVQTGGPSGGCLVVEKVGTMTHPTFRERTDEAYEVYPESLIDLPVDFEQLTKAGSMMGSGGMIVMDEETCMVDVARYFLNFLREESCGKCTPCREGIRRMLEILENIVQGKGRKGDVETLEEIAETVIDASLCALGGTAPNPVLSTIRYFREEYDEHILEKKCRAGVCRALITYSVDAAKCDGCHSCVSVCPTNCISGEKKKVHSISPTDCIKCRSCVEICPKDAILRS